MNAVSTFQKTFSVCIFLVMSTLFAQAQSQFTAVTTNITPTSLPESSPSYTANGSFEITVANGTMPLCTIGLYTVNATPVPSSSPLGNTPASTITTTYNLFSPGDFMFLGASAGLYTVTVTESGGCTPPINPIIFTVLVPEGVSIPTLTEWGLFILGIVFSIFGIVAIKKKEVRLS